MEKVKTPGQTDGARLQTVLNRLNLSANKVAKTLEYGSPSSVYHVIHGRNSLSTDMILGIIRHWPEASYSYLKEGKGEPVLHSKSEKIAQQKLFGLTVPKELNIDTEDKEEPVRLPGDPLTYNVNQQLQLIIENGKKQNDLMKELIQENKLLRKALLALSNN